MAIMSDPEPYTPKPTKTNTQRWLENVFGIKPDKPSKKSDIREAFDQLFSSKPKKNGMTFEELQWRYGYGKQKEITSTEIASKLNDLFNRIIGSGTPDSNELYEDIRYVGQCEGFLKINGDLPNDILRKLNDLWKKYK